MVGKVSRGGMPADHALRREVLQFLILLKNQTKILLRTLDAGRLCPSMGLPQFDVQGSLFESLGSIAPQLFGDQDKYQLFAKKVLPVLARCREQLAECYTSDNGRPGIEPVVLLGVLIFQFLERVPDRQAVEMVKYHLGWKLALNLKLGDPGFHSTTLV